LIKFSISFWKTCSIRLSTTGERFLVPAYNGIFLFFPTHYYYLTLKQIYFALFLLAGCWMACTNDNSSAPKLPGGPNSDLVNNPMTASGTLDTNRLARIRFDQEEFDFGSVQIGTIVEHDFTFTNTGKVGLSILNARSSCGCTVPEWPKEVIPPGQSAAIKAKFNTEGRPGEQRKLIMVTANTYPNETKILLKGNVEDEK
jgi:hypothetical protein